MNNIYQLEFKLFFRNRASLTGILILLLSGFGGLYFGKTFINKQEAVIAKAAIIQQQNIEKNLKFFNKDLGLLLFYNKFSVANVPDRWAAFANGQRDINPYLISVTILGLEGQLYDTDLNNPSTLLLGNMDLAFVFVFLFPLVIIAFTYNLLSADQEMGIWSLMRAQSFRPLPIILRKLLVRMIVVFGLMLVLMLAAALYLQLRLDQRFLTVLLLISSYLLFWFALAFWVISRLRSSSFNALSLIAFWVLLNIVSPAVLNVWLTEKYPIPEALENVLKQREGYHEKWDMDKTATMDKFYSHYPQFKRIPFPAELTFSWYWYYAMQQMGDDEAALSTKKMTQKLIYRQGFTNWSSLLLPGIQLQLGLNELAGSDLQNHLQFQDTVRAYHEKLRLQFYPAIFNDGKAESIHLSEFKIEHVKNLYQGLSARYFAVVFISILLIFGALSNFKRKHSVI